MRDSEEGGAKERKGEEVCVWGGGYSVIRIAISSIISDFFSA